MGERTFLLETHFCEANFKNPPSRKRETEVVEYVLLSFGKSNDLYKITTH
jgi:hypothetical protein